MTTHTPGPWTIDDDRFIVSNKMLIGQTFNTCDEYSANARLIAAAPDLLEALEYLVGAYDIAAPTADDWDRARLAISKAKGK